MSWPKWWHLGVKKKYRTLGYHITYMMREEGCIVYTWESSETKIICKLTEKYYSNYIFHIIILQVCFREFLDDERYIFSKKKSHHLPPRKDCNVFGYRKVAAACRIKWFASKFSPSGHRYMYCCAFIGFLYKFDPCSVAHKSLFESFLWIQSDHYWVAHNALWYYTHSDMSPPLKKI